MKAPKKGIPPKKQYYCRLRCIKVTLDGKFKPWDIINCTTKKAAEDAIVSGFWEIYDPERLQHQQEPEALDPMMFFEQGDFEPSHLAELLMKRHIFKTLTDTREMLVYKNGVYVPGGEVLILAECRQILKEKCRQRRTNEVQHLIQCSTFADRLTFDGNKNLLNVRNGLFDLDTWTLLPHSPDILSFVQLPVTYDPSADCPTIKKFFSEVVQEKDVPLLSELTGFSLLPDYRIQKAAMLTGEGNNGKGTFLRLLTAFLGKENTSAVSLRDFSINRFATASLYGKYANLCADISSTELNNTGIFKMLTGGDTIRAERKGREPFNFTNRAKLMFSANTLPASRDETRGFWRRWLIIEFCFCFDGREDTDLDSKLQTEKELSGLLNMALEALKRLISLKKFSRDDDSEAIARDYTRRANPVHAFVEDWCELKYGDENWFEEKETFYARFKDYTKENRLPTLSQSEFGGNINRLPGISGQKRGSKGQQKPVYVGIQLMEDKRLQKTLDTTDTMNTNNSITSQKTLDTIDTIDTGTLGITGIRTFSSTRYNSDILKKGIELLDKNEESSLPTPEPDLIDKGWTPAHFESAKLHHGVYEACAGFWRRAQ